jgi:hypothetical protein
MLFACLRDGALAAVLAQTRSRQAVYRNLRASGQFLLGDTSGKARGPEASSEVAQIVRVVFLRFLGGQGIGR